ncbi:hypothetical protein EC960932_0755, partial [Escherichia coli 96.0932]
IFS